MAEESVKVAVRVRPFNDREKARKAALIIDMPDGKRTGIRDLAAARGDVKWFAFDNSYWSHDGYAVREEDGYLERAAGTKYADQMQVFNDLGKGVLDNAWKGYNCSLFAYGQTGSGKSYSMVGYGANKGIVPIACEELFRRIEEKGSSAAGVEYQVSVSMFEIYCERVRDLLSSKTPPKGGLKVREHPKKGFYVEELRQAPVKDYASIEAKIDQGTRNRTVAATNMNATSSRAHTLVQISFVQNNAADNTTKTSLINLVDLAGSERHNDAGTEGDRLKEGIVINKSLSTLGRCITADRAKSIKTKAVVNESATDRLIRELREENKRLAQLLSSGGAAAPSLGGQGNGEELETLRKQLEGNKLEMEQMELTWQQRLQEEGKRSKTTDGEKAQTEENKKKLPHFWNLNEDAALTGIIVHFISPGTSLVGNKQAQPPADVQLNGLSIQKEHATVTNRDNKKIGLAAMAGAEILVNGKRVVKDVQLGHNDRVLFGGNHLYVFAHPAQLAKQKKKKKRSEQQHEITYEMAQAEIAENSGIMGMNKAAGGASKTKEDLILEEELVQLMPQVYRANAMSDELNKKVHFEIVLVAPQARGAPADGHTEIFVRVLNQADDLEFLWEKNKFINRYYGMQELYQNFIEGYSDWDVLVERDPFHEPQNSEVPIGGVHVYLQSLAYMVELDDQLPITDFRGAEHGHLQVSLVPCSPQGQEITGEFVDKPQDLVGKNLSFKVKIFGAIGLPRKFSRSRCSYMFYLENKEATTSELAGSNPNYSHEKIFSFKPVTKQLVDYLKDSALYIQVLGRQIGKGNQRRRPSLPTYNQPTDASHLKHVEALLQAAIRKGSKQISVKDLAAAMGVSSLSSSSSPSSVAPAKRAKGHSQPKSASSGDSAIVKDKDAAGSTAKRKVSKKAKSKPK